jgi:hypothetical protein
MIMKRLACLVLAVTAVECGIAQVRPTPHEWKATLKVVDENDRPVSGAEVWVAYNVAREPGQTKDWDKVAGLTDTNGIFTTSHVDRSVSLGFHAQKAGYYSTWMQYSLGFSSVNDPVLWNPTATLILKRIIRPIPMFAKWVDKPPPVSNEPIGYDLMAGDWVAPHGKGLQTDLIFEAAVEKRTGGGSDYKLTVSFPSSGDGIQEFRAPPLPVDEGSDFRSPHQAPADGYRPQWVQARSRRSGEPTISNRDDSRNYFFRVRTVIDENGNVKSALYGKIYGDFMRFRYYLNPEPNSRNVEFDPKQNLLKGLKSTEQVDAP